MNKLPGERLKQWLAIATLIVLAVVLFDLGAATSAAQRANQSVTAKRKPRRSALGSVDQFKEAFQNDEGKVRLVALISPT